MHQPNTSVIDRLHNRRVVRTLIQNQCEVYDENIVLLAIRDALQTIGIDITNSIAERVLEYNRLDMLSD